MGRWTRGDCTICVKLTTTLMILSVVAQVDNGTKPKPTDWKILTCLILTISGDSKIDWMVDGISCPCVMLELYGMCVVGQFY